jgi:SRSO17 transposase
MGPRLVDGSEARFAAYVEGLASVIGHADRVAPLEAYCIGLLLPGERKSVEPMAAITAPERVSNINRCCTSLPKETGLTRRSWARCARWCCRRWNGMGQSRHGSSMTRGFPKQGKHSVGVARQYCGQLGKQDNCQVAVTLSLANHHASLPVAYRLYLPKEWADDEERCRTAGVPDDIGFKTKPEIALEQVRWALEAGLPRGVVLMDAGYGASTELRARIAALDLPYVAGIGPQNHRVGTRRRAIASKEMVGPRTTAEIGAP